MQLFAPKPPKIPEAPKAPTTDSAVQAEEDIMRLRRRRGLASTFLVGKQDRTRTSAAASLAGGVGTGSSLGSGVAGSSAGGGGSSPTRAAL